MAMHFSSSFWRRQSPLPRQYKLNINTTKEYINSGIYDLNSKNGPDIVSEILHI